MRNSFLAGLCSLTCLLALGPDAAANGRAPGSSTIHFRRGMESQIAAGLTFGLVISKDGGATWNWMCENAINYTGMYDPYYAFSSTGGLFATTFDGLQVTRDGCTFAPPMGSKFISVITQASNGSLYIAASDVPQPGNPGDSKIYRSDDDGMTWPVSGSPGILNDWWQSIEAAPSNPNRVYLSGYRFIPNPGGQGNIRAPLLFRSDNGGATWQPLPTSGFSLMGNSILEIGGVSYTNPDLVYAHVKLEDNAISDAIYRSTDAGQTWTKVLVKGGGISFVVRRNGDLVAATQALGAVRSTNNGSTWTDLASPPHINCIAENSAGEIWACTQNYGGMAAPSDGFGIMKTSDLAAWTGVLKFQQIKGPVACAGGTVQKDTCDTMLWCGVCQQLGCTQSPECAGPQENTGGDNPSDDHPGCCNRAPPAPGALLLLVGVGALVLRPRRRGSAR